MRTHKPSPSETWKPITDFPAYEVSDHGRVRRIAGGQGTRGVGHIHCPVRTKTGYLFVGLRCGGAKALRLVHRLVAQAFVKRPAGATEVNHIDGVKAHNAASNLEWVTHAENQAHASASGLMRGLRGEDSPRASLTDALVMTLRGEARSGKSIQSLATQHGIPARTVAHAVRGTRWGHLHGAVPSVRPGRHLSSMGPVSPL